MKFPVLAAAVALLAIVCSAAPHAQSDVWSDGDFPDPAGGHWLPQGGTWTSESGCSVKKSGLPCRRGYVSVGSKCYKFVRERQDWQGAALLCGADGAGLARYDNSYDKVLGQFFEKILEHNLDLKGSSRVISCQAGSTCKLPCGKVGLRVKLSTEAKVKGCQDKVFLSKDRRKLVVGGGCGETSFVVETVGFRDYLAPRTVVAWVGGNTRVLKPGQRKGKTPFQVDPPRAVPSCKSQGVKGCFQASRTAQGRLDIRPNSRCGQKLPYICGYDNTVRQDYDPLDYVLIKEELTYDTAILRCNELNRPLASIENTAQQAEVEKLVKGCQSDAWMSAVYSKASKVFTWGDGSFMVYTNWQDGDARASKAWLDHHCSSISKTSGQWQTRKCGRKFFALCGPSDKKKPLAFTPFYPVDGYNCIVELKETLRRLKQKDYVCEKPKLMQCSARSEVDGNWVTNDQQTSDTITCSKDEISCKRGRELNCATFQVRFLCPQEEDQCQELSQLKAPACRGGQQCFPVTNHYVCRCPPGTIYSEYSKECVSFCGECSAWGDPHYSTLSGKKYDFMGNCKYKFTGVFNKQDFGDSPNFDIYTTNIKCMNQLRPDGSCLEDVEIQLRNIPVTSRCGYTRPENFVFKVTAKDNFYQLNGKKVSDPVTVKEGVYKAVVRHAYFSLVVYSLELRIFLNGRHLRVRVPERFQGQLAGLCGDCGTDQFRLRNGTMVAVKQWPDGDGYDSTAVRDVALDWMVKSEEFADKKCGVELRDNRCSDDQRAKVSEKKLCGIFLEKNNALQNCFDVAKFSRLQFYHDCIYDLCEMGEPYEAVCGVVQSFAQQCAARGVLVNWRSDNFCPMTCGPDQVFRADASCQKQCGPVSAQSGPCDEEPAEGCTCRDGLYLLKGKCVTQQQCGCPVSDAFGHSVKFLFPEESVVLPQCREKVICERNVKGQLEDKHVDFTMPRHSVCSGDVPPEIRCAVGYVRAEDGKTCKRYSGCKKGFKDTADLCLSPTCGKARWSDAVGKCDGLSGALVYVDTAEKMDSLQQFLNKKGWQSMLVAGRVLALNNFGFVSFHPADAEAERTSSAWVNSHFYPPFLDKVSLMACMKPEDIPQDGLEMGVVVKVTKGGLTFVAVPDSSSLNFVCEQRW